MLRTIGKGILDVSLGVAQKPVFQQTVAAALNPPSQMPTTFSAISQGSGGGQPSGGGQGGGGEWSNAQIVGGLVVAACCCVGAYQGYQYLFKAQNTAVRDGVTEWPEIIGELINDPKKMSAFKKSLYNEFKASGGTDKEIQARVVAHVREIRKQAGVNDSIPPNVKGIGR